jgi:hypothetical protein
MIREAAVAVVFGGILTLAGAFVVSAEVKAIDDGDTLYKTGIHMAFALWISVLLLFLGFVTCTIYSHLEAYYIRKKERAERGTSGDLEMGRVEAGDVTEK